MEGHIAAVYLSEVATQCRYAVNAARQVNSLLQAPRKLPDGNVDWERQRFIDDEIFRSLHSLLTHASNVSRLLWPPVRQAAAIERGGELRRLLSVPDDSPLRSRTLRNHLEHFDDRLDHWNETSEHHNLVQNVIGPPGIFAGIDQTDMMRWFETTTLSFTFRGESYDLQALITALDALLPAAEAEAERIRIRPEAAGQG